MPSNPETDDGVPVPNVVPVAQMSGDDDEDTRFLREMLEQAKNYIQSFSWCDSIVSSYFAGGVGKVFAIFLFKINSTRHDVDPWEWVFVGDIPLAYLPLEDATSKIAAFEAYIEGMKRWVEVARQGREPEPEDCCPPVNIPATPDWAEKLDSRLQTLAEVVKPFFE
jgi:hypothetical protein